ncbi:MAG: ABC-2 family transporter protein [Acidobacteriota bacterium]
MRKLLAAFATSARERSAYRAELLGTAVFLGILLFIFSRLWIAVGQEQGTGRYSVAKLLFYLVVTELVTMSPGNVHVRIGDDVKSGEIALALLRPVGYVPWELAKAAGSAFVRLAMLTIFGIPAAFLLVGMPDLEPMGVLIGIGILVPAAVLVETCVRLLMGLLAFWFEDAAPFFWIWQKSSFVLGGLMMPLDLYPQWLRRVTEVLPFQALLYGPARTVVDFDPRFALRAFATLACWGLVLMLLLTVVYDRGRRRVQVNGG